ncbi:MAG: hypothetical protein JWQ98_751 [Chlorobi bacterium]|nr:hypothetical protein [Chlorobiota bacterium]
MAVKQSTRQEGLLNRAGCWAVGLYVFAIFFALGAIISLVNGDAMRALGSLLITAIAVGGGIWLARRHAENGRR